MLCAPESKKEGEWTEDLCKTAASPAKTGAWELYPYTGPEGIYEWIPATECALYPSPGEGVPDVEYTALAPCPEKLSGTDKTGVATLTGATGVIECKKSVSTDTITSPYTDVENVKFETCTTKGVKCTTAKWNEVTKKSVETGTVGDISTNTLDTTLIDNGTKLPQLNEKGEFKEYVEPAVGEAWTLFESSESAPYVGIQASYICKGVAEIQTVGLLAGVDTPANTMEASLTTTFAEGKGLQVCFSEVDTEPNTKPRCEVEPKGEGEWTEAKCETAASPAKTGGYELNPAYTEAEALSHSAWFGTPIGQGIEKAVGLAKGGEKEEIRTF